MWIRDQYLDFHGGPVVKTPCFHCGGYGPDPTQGTKIPHAMQHGQKLTKKKKKGGQDSLFY